MRTPRFRLLQARLLDSPVREEERLSFAMQLGVPLDHVEPFDLLHERPSVDAFCDGVDAVLVGGSGKFSIYDQAAWIAPFVDTLGEVADRQVPMFASCFGFQALVVALGHPVEKDEPNAEVGTFELRTTAAAQQDPLFGPLPERFHAQLGHKDRATSFPEGAVLLASSDRCPYQALRIGSTVYATQFHPELTASANRARFARYLDDYRGVFGTERADQMLDEFVESPHADGLLARFKDLLAR